MSVHLWGSHKAWRKDGILRDGEPAVDKGSKAVIVELELWVRCSRLTLLKAAGLDLRRVSPDWAFNQLLHNYTEECLLHIFATWAFTLGQLLTHTVAFLDELSLVCFSCTGH